MQNINFYNGSMCQEIIRLVQVIYFCDEIFLRSNNKFSLYATPTYMQKNTPQKNL